MSLEGKTPTFSGHALHDQYPFQGMQISVENKAGSTREWHDRNGRSGKTEMLYDYGYIRRTLGKDGDHIDCYVGPNKESPKAFIIHQNVNGKHDEDKVMLGFDSKEEAEQAFLKHYDDPSFLGGCTEMTVDELKEKIIGKEVPKITKALIQQVIMDIIQKATKKFSMEDAQRIGNKMGISWEKYDLHEFHMGLNVELEHGTKDTKTNVTGDGELDTAKIALAHLNEIPDYYTKLKSMEARKSFIDVVKSNVKQRLKKKPPKADKSTKGRPQSKGKKKGKKNRNLKVSSQAGRMVPWNPKSRYTDMAHKRRPPSVPTKTGLRPYSVTTMDRVRHVKKESSIPASMVNAPQTTLPEKRTSHSGDVSSHSVRADTTRTKMRGRKKYSKSFIDPADLKKTLSRMIKEKLEKKDG